MFRLPKSILAVGGAALATVLLILAAPRTVHAVAAALVQVTNTSSNPVVTQSIGQQAAQSIHLTCYNACTAFNISGSNVSYIVPDNQSLIITAVDITPTQIYISPACNVNHLDGLYITSSGGSAYSQIWVVASTSMHLSYPSGMVFPSGTTFTNATIYTNPISPPSCYSSADFSDKIDLYGYLTAS
jgi:hypothetical protein